MAISQRKEVTKIARECRRQGWTVDILHGGHLRFVTPEGVKYTTGSSPSDWRSLQALRVDLRKLGYRDPGRVHIRKEKR